MIMTSMRLYRTVCHTDWKGRPSHQLKLLAVSDDQEWLREQMDKDVREWMAADVARREWEDQSEGKEDVTKEDEIKFLEERVLELVGDSSLVGKWAVEHEKWEMSLPDKIHREFVEKDEGDLTTTVYHFMEE